MGEGRDKFSAGGGTHLLGQHRGEGFGGPTNLGVLVGSPLDFFFTSTTQNKNRGLFTWSPEDALTKQSS